MIFSKIGVFYMENLNSFVTIQKFNEKGYINLNYVFSDLFNGEYPMLHPINSSNIKYFPQIEYFVPKKLKEDFDGDLEENLKYLTYDTNKNYRLGNKIVKNMSKQMVLDFAEQLSISLDNKEIEILDDKQLINFFKIISDKIVPKEILSWGNDIYNIYLSQNDYKQLLSRLVLSLLSLQQPSYAQTERKYLKAVNEEDNYTILSTIWGTFSDSNYKMFKKTVIAFNERKDYDAVKNICELNREFLEEEHEINYLYAAALANCGDITNAEDILNKEQFNDYPNAQYVLYKIYNGAFGSFDTEDLNEKCKKALSKASNLGQPNAALIFIRELFDDNFNVNYNTIKSLLTKMKNNIIELNDTQKGWYYYYSGCCKEKDNLLEEVYKFRKGLKELGVSEVTAPVYTPIIEEKEDSEEVKSFEQSANTEFAEESKVTVPSEEQVQEKTAEIIQQRQSDEILEEAIKNSKLENPLNKDKSDETQPEQFNDMYAKIFGNKVSENVEPIDEKELSDNEKKVFEEIKNTVKPMNEVAEQVQIEKPLESISEENTERLDEFKNMSGKNYKFIGIAFSTYIIVEIENEMYIIDQHAAHERIMYEKVKKNYYSTTDKDSQLMLLPDIINLTHKEAETIKENLEMFEQAGFTLEAFGENTIKLTGVPNICMDMNTKQLFLDLLDEVDNFSRTDRQDKEDRFIATIACKSAVKANMRLDEKEVDTLMDRLLQLPNPFTCPHGRPTAIKMSKYDIERKFARK